MTISLMLNILARALRFAAAAALIATALTLTTLGTALAIHSYWVQLTYILGTCACMAIVTIPARPR